MFKTLLFSETQNIQDHRLIHSFLQDSPPPPNKFDSKIVVPLPLLLPPTEISKFGPLLFVVSPIIYIIFKFSPAQNFQLMYNWFAQTDT